MECSGHGKRSRCHDAIFQSIDQLFDGRLRSTTATAGHHEAIAHPAVPALNPNKAFAWTAGRGQSRRTGSREGLSQRPSFPSARAAMSLKVSAAPVAEAHIGPR